MADKRIMSNINVTPLVDVMLVLLIIFMVTAPMMQTGLDVALPKVDAAAIQTPKEPIVISITADGSIYISKNKIDISKLRTKIKAIFERRDDDTVLLKADAKVRYGHVAEVMSEIRKAGISKIGMLTEARAEKR